MKRLMRSANQSKLELLKYILIKNKTTINDLVEFSHLSRIKLKRLVSEINEDFFELFGNEKNMIIQDEKYVYFVKTECTINELFHKLKLYYFKDSVHFEILYLLISNSDDWSVFDLSQEFIISTSYLYQVIREINEILEDFSLELTRPDGVNFQLVGLEKNIRLFTFLFLSTLYLGVESPFEIERKKLHDFIDLLPISSSEKEQAYYLYMISTQRMSQGYFLEDFPEDVRELLSYFHLPKDLGEFETSMLEPYAKNQEILERERYFIHLLMRVIVRTDENRAAKMMMGKQLMLVDNGIAKYCRKLFMELIEQFDITISEEYFYEALYYLVLMHLFLYIFPVDLEEILSLNYDVTPIEEIRQNIRLEKIIDFYKQFFAQEFIEKNEQLYRNYEEAHILYVCKQLYILLNFFIPKQLKVYTHYAQNMLGNLLVKKKIEQMFNEKTVMITSDVYEADLIISDCVEYEKINTDYFFLYDLSSEAIWENVYEFIQEKVMNNLFNVDRQANVHIDLSMND